MPRNIPPPEKPSLSGKARAALVARSIEHLQKALHLLNMAEAMCADNVAATLDVVRHRYAACWKDRDD